MLTLVTAILVALASILFALQNSFVVTVAFLVWRFEISFAVLIIVSFASGVIVASLLVAPSLLKAAWQNWKVKHL